MGRDISQLHPLLQAKVKQLQAECKKAGLKIGIGECYRTIAEQDALYAKGRTAPGSIVTNARGSSMSSMHQWSVAVDFYRNDGKGAYENKDKFFEKVGKIGKSIGLEWGGEWKSIKDLPHFQLPDWGSTTSKLKSTYGSYAKFKNSWMLAGDKIICIKETAIRTSAGGSKVKYADLTIDKSKCKKASDGTAIFKVGSSMTISALVFTDDGKVWAKSSKGYFFPIFGSSTTYFKKA